MKEKVTKKLKVDYGCVPLDLVEVTNTFTEAKTRREVLFRKFMLTVGTLETDRFWELLNIYRDILLSNHRKFDTEIACDEFFRRSTCISGVNVRYFGDDPPKEGETEGGYTYLEALSFVRSYQTHVSKVYKALDGLELERGDDSYSDLCDSFPLLGQSLFNMAISGKIKDVDKCVNDLAKTEQDKLLAQHVLHGENYNWMCLEIEAEERLACHLRNLHSLAKMAQDKREQNRWNRKQKAKKGEFLRAFA